MNNFWMQPPPEDEYEDFPDWMLPPSKRRMQAPEPKGRSAVSLTEAIEQALKKPAVPININEPDIK